MHVLTFPAHPAPTGPQTNLFAALAAAQSRGPVACPGQAQRSGFAASMPIETANGWQAVRRLRPGDLVQTFDGGLKPLRAVTQSRAASAWVHLPAGAVGNCTDISLPGGQLIALRADLIARLTAASVALVRVADLAGMRGITARQIRGQSGAVTLHFDEEELVYAQTGMLAHCPVTDAAPSLHFNTLDKRQARRLVRMIDARYSGPVEPLLRAENWTKSLCSA